MLTTVPLLCWTLLGFTFALADDKGKPELPSDIAPLVKQLKSKDALERRQAAVALGEKGEAAQAAAPALMEALKDKDLFVRRMAIKSLGQVKGDPDKTIAALKPLLRDDDKAVVEAVAETMGQMGKTAIPALTGMLKDKDPLVKKSAVTALGRMGPEAKDAVPALIAAFKAETPRPRMQAGSLRMVIVDTFAQMGPAAKDAIKPLQDSLEENRDPQFRRAVTEAIRKMGGEPTMPKKKK
jgi:HEAT repeat protein